MSRVLVISPHPDDEAIGCGGTLCEHIAQGDQVRVFFLTSGEKGGHGRGEAEFARVREAEAKPPPPSYATRPLSSGAYPTAPCESRKLW
jgi:LmbE family N-acetylglucosaminyl deacetylase